MNFWRAKDIYSDQMVRFYQFNGVPIERIDNAGFMVGNTGTCYYRGAEAWRGMLVLSLARGGWANTYYGMLDLLSDDEGRWFGKVQQMYMGLAAQTGFTTFGGLPGKEQPYGFAAIHKGSGLLTVVNPSQQIAELKLPGEASKRLLFRDAGFAPKIESSTITLGPEQVAVIGVGSYAEARYDMGVQVDVVIPAFIAPIAVSSARDGDKAIVSTLTPPATGDLRIILRQREANGLAKRSSGGFKPTDPKLGAFLKIDVRQAGQAIPVRIQYDKAIWSGLSWAVGEVSRQSIQKDQPLTIRLSTSEPAKVELTCELFEVRY